VVVLVAALLANTVPAGEVLAAASAARVRGGVQAQQLQAGPLRLQVGLEPGTVGRNLLQVHVTDPSGRPVDGLASIDLTVADQAGRAAPTAVRAARVAPATYRAVTDAFTLPGSWRVGAAVPGAPPGLAARFAITAAPATWHGTPTDVLAFVDVANGAYHRLWVDHANRILHERMDAPGHFMDRDYTAYNTPATITPPVAP
jgi:hypothetical protein